ncbi:MAG: hypothetical protein Q8O91_12380 [Candidatus Aminicenantes bacterium]|nr:hypothetical protein [Candidatus Aminicenantes bacterium]
MASRYFFQRYSITGIGVTNAGAGLKIRLMKWMGILLEYRAYTYKTFGIRKAIPLIGGGISYLF